MVAPALNDVGVAADDRLDVQELGHAVLNHRGRTAPPGEPARDGNRLSPRRCRGWADDQPDPAALSGADHHLNFRHRSLRRAVRRPSRRRASAPRLVHCCRKDRGEMDERQDFAAVLDHVLLAGAFHRRAVGIPPAGPPAASGMAIRPPPAWCRTAEGLAVAATPRLPAAFSLSFRSRVPETTPAPLCQARGRRESGPPVRRP